MSVCVFSLFLSFTEKEYQTEAKRNKTFIMIFLGPEDTQKTWGGGQNTHEDSTSNRGHPRGHAYPPGRALLPRGRLVEFHTSTPSLLDCFQSKKDHREGFIPFGLRLVFLFCKTLKIGKKTKTGTVPPVNRLVRKII